MEGVTTTVRRRTGFTDLPPELTGMILEHVISDIDIDHPVDLQRWTCNVTNTSDTSKTITKKSRPYHSAPILGPGQQLYNKVKVTLRPRPQNESEWQTGNIIVMVPRKWIELLQSGVFRECDLPFFGRNMDIQVTSLRPRYTNYIVHGPDTRTESTVRALLARTEQIRGYDLNLHALHFSPANLACYLPRLQNLEVFHEGITPWFRRHTGHPTFVGLDLDLRALRIVTEQEVHDLQRTGDLPDGLVDLIRIRNYTLETLLRWYPGAPMSLVRLRQQLSRTGWRGRTTHVIFVKCIVEGSKGWLGSRLACIALVLDLDWMHGWGTAFAGVSGDSCQDSVETNVWASLLHYNL